MSYQSPGVLAYCPEHSPLPDMGSGWLSYGGQHKQTPLSLASYQLLLGQHWMIGRSLTEGELGVKSCWESCHSLPVEPHQLAQGAASWVLGAAPSNPGWQCTRHPRPLLPSECLHTSAHPLPLMSQLPTPWCVALPCILVTSSECDMFCSTQF